MSLIDLLFIILAIVMMGGLLILGYYYNKMKIKKIRQFAWIIFIFLALYFSVNGYTELIYNQSPKVIVFYTIILMIIIKYLAEYLNKYLDLIKK